MSIFAITLIRRLTTAFIRNFALRTWLHGLPLVSLSGLLFVGCGNQPAAHPAHVVSSNTISERTLEESSNIVISAGMQGNPLDSTNVNRAYFTRGVIREFPGGNGLVVTHEEIPDYMPKMTMEFAVRDTNELRGLAVGDNITFVVRATDEESWIERIQRAGKGDLPPPLPRGPSAAALLDIAELKEGEVLPDAELLAEDGRTIKLSDFKGQALAFTFIFTRCPLPDFCPRMNQHFSRARDLLVQQPGGPTNWQFLSISFDPEFDKPGVLSRYAYSYRGQNPDRWLFAAAPTNVMASMVSQLNFRFAREGGSFVHNLRTVVLDPQARLHRQFDGNKWKAQDLADSMVEACQLAQKRSSFK